jgi:DNA-binding MarR family transcriptional regulator
MGTDHESLQDLREQHVGRLLLLAHRAFSARAAVLLQERGYPEVALRHIDLLPHIDVAGTRSTVLAGRVAMTKQGTGKLVAELEGLGLVERVPDPADGRAMLVRFTDAGMRFLTVAVEVVQALEEEYRVVLGDADLQALKSSLGRIVERGR